MVRFVVLGFRPLRGHIGHCRGQVILVCSLQGKGLGPDLVGS